MNKKREINYSGELHIGDFTIPCYVLDDGTRVISTKGMQRILGIIGNEPQQKSSGRLKDFIKSKALSPFIHDDGGESKYEPLVCYKGTQKVNAFEAIRLPEMCDLILKMRDNATKNNIELGSRQKGVIMQADMIIRALSKIGIIALVDEATGYQYDREKKELQAILQLFISEEILEWQKTFQLSFYKEIFRLWGIPFTAANIKNKPSFIGHITNNYVYDNMPRGSFILEELKKRTPKTEKGNWANKLHQSLTPTGKKALEKVLYTVEALASVAKNKNHFKKLMSDKYGQQSFDFDDIEEVNPQSQKARIINPTKFDRGLKGLLAVPPPTKK